MQYDHTQSAPLHWILIAVGVVMFACGWLVPEMAVRSLLLCCGAIMIVLAFCFRQLTVSDQGEELLISFGPLALFQRRIVYADMESAEPGRTTFLDGWGIHLSPRGGWVWNIWGFDCVDVQFQKRGKFRKVRIGTDDPTGLAAFLKERMGKGNLRSVNSGTSM